jgi:hypothetical protein
MTMSSAFLGRAAAGFLVRYATTAIAHRIADNAVAVLRKFWAKFHIFPKPLDILLKSLKVSTTFVFPKF